MTGVDAIDAPFERPYSRYTTEDLLAFMDGFQLPPGALGTYNYSDVGYGMLGWALHDLYKSQATWESLTEVSSLRSPPPEIVASVALCSPHNELV